MKKNIFIVGSKPELYWPDVPPDQVYFVNSALSRAKELCISSEVTWVVNRFSLYRDPGIAEGILEFVPSNILFFGEEPDGSHFELLNGRAESKRCNIEKLGRYGLIKTKVRFFGVIDTFLYYLRYRVSQFSFLKVFSYKGKGGAFNVSAGMVALMSAIQRFGVEDCKYYLIGIGFASGGGHFDNLSRIYPPDHVANDLRFLKKINEKVKSDIVVTDPGAKEILRNYSKGN